MIEHVTQTDEFLYHYTTVDKALNYILKSRTLRFGAYANSNDPKETKIWRDECEWRWVVFASSDQDLYVAFGNALTGIMFGEDTSERSIQDMMDATDSWGLRYMGLRWKNCSPWFDYSNLRYMPGIKASPWGQAVKRV